MRRLTLLSPLLLLGVAACGGNTLTFEAWPGDSSPAEQIPANYQSAAADTCVRGADLKSQQVISTSKGDLYQYRYTCKS